MISPVSLTSRHLRCELVRVGGATGQELRLLRPRRRQRTGDWCPAQRLNGNGLGPANGLVAVDAVRVMSGSRLVVVEKRRLSAAIAAGIAAHAGIAPMHRAR
jgi:hypothetical protein